MALSASLTHPPGSAPKASGRPPVDLGGRAGAPLPHTPVRPAADPGDRQAGDGACEPRQG